mmetsp:Transcript_28972/g.92648  ORF Transcript_28972/g.92648 Transcript_28972/m.92648 type:complete len:489 (-) Transcript_28972:18-1484(-)
MAAVVVRHFLKILRLESIPVHLGCANAAVDASGRERRDVILHERREIRLEPRRAARALLRRRAAGVRDHPVVRDGALRRVPQQHDEGHAPAAVLEHGPQPRDGEVRREQVARRRVPRPEARVPVVRLLVVEPGPPLELPPGPALELLPPAPVEEVRLPAPAPDDHGVLGEVLVHARRARLLRPDDEEVRRARARARLAPEVDAAPRLPQLVPHLEAHLGHAREAQLRRRRLVDVVEDEVRPELVAEIRHEMLSLVVELDDLPRRQAPARQRILPGAHPEHHAAVGLDRAVQAVRVAHPVARVVVRRDHRPRRHGGEQAAHHALRRDAGRLENRVQERPPLGIAPERQAEAALQEVIGEAEDDLADAPAVVGRAVDVHVPLARHGLAPDLIAAGLELLKDARHVGFAASENEGRSLRCNCGLPQLVDGRSLIIVAHGARRRRRCGLIEEVPLQAELFKLGLAGAEGRPVRRLHDGGHLDLGFGVGLRWG